MESRNHQNILFILKKGKVTSLADVLIEHTVNTGYKSVSHDDLIQVALAADYEISREEKSEKISLDLLELYRIRYQCVQRLAAKLKAKDIMADSEYGKAARAYVFLHVSAAERDELKAAGISAPGYLEGARGIAPPGLYDAFSKYAYDTFNHVAREYFSHVISEQQKKAAQMQQYAQNAEAVRNKYFAGPDEDLTFTMIGDDAMLHADLQRTFVPPQREKMEVQRMNIRSPFVEIDAAYPIRILDEATGSGLQRLVGLFERPASLLSRADMEQRIELETLVKKKGERMEKAEFDKIKIGTIMLRYHHDLAKYENEMNGYAAATHDVDYPKTPRLLSWCNRWESLQKYARTPAEYLPNFLEKLDVLDDYVKALTHDLRQNTTLSAEQKAQCYIEIIRMKSAIDEERQLIIESMLARLELVNRNELITRNEPRTVFDIVYGQVNEGQFYCNLVHDEYGKYCALRDREFEVPERFRRKDLDVNHIRMFADFIREKGDEVQQRRLDVLLPEYRSRMMASYQAMDDYGVPEPADFIVNIADGPINIAEITAPDYIGAEVLMSDDAAIEDMRAKVAALRVRSDEEARREAAPVIAMANIQGLGETNENHLLIYYAVKSVPRRDVCEVLFTQDRNFTNDEREFFARLFLQEYGADIVNKELFVRLIRDYSGQFIDAYQLNQFISHFIKTEKTADVSELLSRINVQDYPEEVVEEVDLHEPEQPQLLPRKKFMEDYPVLRNVLIYGAVGLIAGPVTIAALALTATAVVPVLIIGGIVAGAGLMVGMIAGAIAGAVSKFRKRRQEAEYQRVPDDAAAPARSSSHSDILPALGGRRDSVEEPPQPGIGSGGPLYRGRKKSEEKEEGPANKPRADM